MGLRNFKYLWLGTNLLVENNNIGRHLDGDAGQGFNAWFSEPLSEGGREGRPFWTTLKPKPWGELGVQLSGGGGDVPPPWTASMQGFAPQYGWKHKEFMRDGKGPRHIMGFGNHLGAIPWSWRLTPDGVMESVSLDEKRIDAILKEAAEVSLNWYDKMAVKPEMIDRRGSRATALRMAHHSGTARAGADRSNSVCTSDFDSHDIDHLIITSSASIPRTTLCWGMGPTAVGAAYAWRRILTNHFSRGCSTKGFA